MDDLFLVVLLISLGAIFYFRKKDKQKRNIAIGVAIASFVLFGLSTDDTEVKETVSEEEPVEQVEEEPEEVIEEEPEEVIEEEPEEEPEEVEAEDTYDNVFEEKANEIFGENLQDVFVDEAGEATEHYVGITSKLSGGWNEKTMRNSFYNNVVAVVSDLQNEEFDRLVFDATADMQDEYGNVKEMKVLTVNLTKETVDKINFENFQSSNLPNVADAIFVHPAFQD